MPVRKENNITKPIYSRKFSNPNTIFNAPRFVIFVAGPVIIKAAALPMLIPSISHACKSGIVPPPQAYRGTPMVAAISTPKASFPPKAAVITSSGTYLGKRILLSSPRAGMALARRMNQTFPFL